MPVTDYSTTPGSNATVNGINIAEGCAPAGINDAIRQIMADIAGWRSGSVVPAFSSSISITGNLTASQVVDGTTIGASNAGVRVRGQADGNVAILQFTNNTASTQWGAFQVSSAGVGSWIGELREGGARVVTNVVTSLGYTPANKAGDTFTGAVTVSAGLRGTSLGVGTAASGTPGRIDATSIYVSRVESGCAYTPPVAATVAGTTTIDCNAGNVFTLAMGTNISTLALNNANNGQTINIRFYQDATGSRTISWPASFKWPGGTAPALSTAGNAGDLLVATYFADVGQWWATLSKAFS